jgi:tyrosyl-tRNA synthetase
VTESADEMFGKLMSVSDDLMWKYYLLLTDLSAAEIDARRARVAAGDLHPKQAKVDLAKLIVSGFHATDAAEQAAQNFDARFTRGEIAGEVPEVTVDAPEGSIGLPKLVVAAGLATSSSDATRKIQQGAIRVDREKVIDIKMRVESPRELTLEAGRRIVRVQLRRV